MKATHNSTLPRSCYTKPCRTAQSPGRGLPGGVEAGRLGALQLVSADQDRAGPLGLRHSHSTQVRPMSRAGVPGDAWAGVAQGLQLLAALNQIGKTNLKSTASVP